MGPLGWLSHSLEPWSGFFWWVQCLAVCCLVPLISIFETPDGVAVWALLISYLFQGFSAFEKLKRLFSAKPVLKHPNPEKPFVIQTDVSNIMVGAMLLQKNEGGATTTLCLHNKKAD